jgi:outer membrane protein
MLTASGLMVSRVSRAALAALALVLGSSAARAQPPLSLREAIRYARAHQPTIAAALARLEAARAQADIPRAARAPRITGAAELLGGTSNNTTTSYATIGILDVARIGGTPANAPISWRPEPSTIAGVALHQEIYDFGKLAAQADAYDALARAADDSAHVAQLDLDLLVEESFYAVLGAKAVLAAADGAVTRSQAHHDLAQAKVGAQLWPQLELTRADADLARYQVDRIRAQGALAIARAVLAAAIGSDDAAVDAGADDLGLPAVPPAWEAADERVPELRAAHELLLAQQHTTQAIRDELKPDLSLSAEVTTRAGGAGVSTNPSPDGDGWLPDVPNYDAAIVFSWPIFDRVVTTRAKVSERVEAVRKAEIDEITDKLRTIAQRGSTELDVARAALPALQRALDAAQANHAQVEARFTGGLGTAVELSDAEALLTDAQIQVAVGQFQLSRARARLARALAESTP